MKQMLWVLAVAALVAGCKDKDKSTSATKAEATKPASCADQTTTLKPWLEGLYGGKPTTAPWPTGDGAFDAELQKLRDEVRELRKAADPGAPAAPLAPGMTRGRLDKELESCAPATAQLQKISEAPPDQVAATWVGLADAIAACDCKPSIPRVKALLYLAQRGPD